MDSGLRRNDSFLLRQQDWISTLPKRLVRDDMRMLWLARLFGVVRGENIKEKAPYGAFCILYIKKNQP
ncbi:MAG TPA: hypothetical protein DD400_04390 [Rhodospirillaceae bacterium]|nr:hypothetical protein [Rhodospirillaceae bacterium]